ncbi:hypothetical protein A167_00276 [Alcanivorax sp. S71-1-4]|uniref:hypothetical protein n=1 Tax=Alcanivorax sp. S71-1-4 TaxID=1177159 RepID=UPI001356760B|nr:hypothetical protein [Alcanivorax sp. S71-1-4]KAF0810789.1 hypothetical protein A167_00276 [Alcanivorax sp. S71-1-4]
MTDRRVSHHSLNATPPRPAAAGATRLFDSETARRIDHWLDEHATALDADGQPVTSLFLADDVVAYRIDSLLVSARTSDMLLQDMARQLARRHHLGDDGIALLQRALDILRGELRQQPGA